MNLTCKYIWISLCVVILFSCKEEKYANPFNDLKLSAKSYYLFDFHSKTLLLEKNSNSVFPSASTIKLFTVLYSRQFLKDNQWVLISKKALELHPLASRAGLRRGERYNYKDLVYAMLVASANDAAIATANFISDDEKKFAQEMTDWMHKNNFLQTTTFDSTGMSYNTITSASDLGKLLKEIRSISDIYEILFLQSVTITSFSGREISLTNRNELLNYKGFQIGGKTGSHKKAGKCFAGFIRNKERLYAIVLLASESYVQDLKQIIGEMRRDQDGKSEK